MKLTRKALLPILAVSFTQIARAVTFDTFQTGDWDDPNTWNQNPATPDVYAGDEATINAAHVVSFNGLGSTFPGGNLVIANDGKIIVDGGTLTQIWAPAVPPALGTGIAIGAVAGAGNGNGTLTISNAGTFDSGTANAVVVGLSLGGPVGNGLVDINDGTFLMNLASSGGAGGLGLGVGIDTGATGVINVGDGVGAAGSAILDLATNNVTLAIADVLQTAVAGTGTVTINSDGSLTAGTGGINVGRAAGAVALLDVKSGGALTIGTGTIFVGSAGNTSANFNVEGTVASGGEIRIGGAGGTGTITIAAGGSMTTTGELNVGRDAGSLGTATISGGTVSAGLISVGRDSGAANLMTVSSGGITSSIEFQVGEGVGASGTLNLSGTGSVTTGGEFQIGNNGGTGVANITGGTVFALSYVAIGRNTDQNGGLNGGNGTVNLSGTGTIQKVNNAGSFDIGSWNGGNAGTTNTSGTLNQTGGTIIDTTSDFNVGRDAGVVGVWNMSGGTATLTGQNVRIGRGGNGTALFTGGTVTGINQLVVSADAGSTGLATINYPLATDTMAVNEFYVGNGTGSTGVVNVTAGTLAVAGWTEIGRNGGTGTLNVNGPTAVYSHTPTGGDTQLGYGAGAQGFINVTNGGTMSTNWWLNIGRGGGAGTVTVDGVGSTLTIGNAGGGGIDARLNVGDEVGSSGTVNIINGGVVQGSTETSVGRQSGTTGIMNVNSTGSFTTGNWLIIGNDGGSTGTVNIADAGSSITLTGQYDPGNPGERSRLFIGRSGNGTLNQTGGTIKFGGWSAIGLDGGGVGTYNMSGGLLETYADRDFDWFIGRAANSQGFLNVSGTADFSMLTDAANGDPGGRNGMRMNIGTDNGAPAGQGTVAVSGGTLSVLSLTVGARGQGTVNQTGGTVNVGQWIEIGQENEADSAGNLATYNLIDGTINAQQIVVGSRRAGAMNISGGTINLGHDGTMLVNGWGDFAVGRDGGGADHGNGHLTMTGGVINGNGKHFQIARGGVNTAGLVDMSGGDINGLSLMTIGEAGATSAVVNLSGGTITTTAEVRVAEGVNTIGTLNLSGTGLLTVGGEFQVGNNGGTGVANITAGTVNALGYVAIGRNTDQNGGLNGGNGTVNLSGTGVLQKVAGGGSFDIGSWNGGNGATTNTTGTLNQSGGSVVIGNNTSLYVGRDTGVSGNYTITAGTVTANVNEFRVHNAGGGATTASVMTVGGTDPFTLVAAGNSAVGQGAGGTGTLNITNPNATFTFNNEFWVGNDSGNGTMNMSAGSITANSWFDLGRNSGTGVLNFSGGTITKLTGTGTVDIGSSGTGNGTLNQSGTAALVNTATDTYVGREATSVGLWDMSGGTATLARLNVGNDGLGTLTMTGGSLSASDRVSIGTNGTATGTANLNGGIVTTNFVEAGSGIATLSLNGGTLQAMADQADFIRGFTNSGGHSAIQLEGLASGGTIDSNGFRVRITAGNVIDGSDALTDGLAGTALTIAGDATLYNDTDKVTLEIPVGTGDLSVHVLSGGYLDFEVPQTLDALVIDAGGYVEFSSLSSPPGAPLGAAAVPGFSPVPYTPGSTLNLTGSASSGTALAPEPGSLGLLLVGALGFLGRRRRSR